MSLNKNVYLVKNLVLNVVLNKHVLRQIIVIIHGQDFIKQVLVHVQHVNILVKLVGAVPQLVTVKLVDLELSIELHLIIPRHILGVPKFGTDNVNVNLGIMKKDKNVKNVSFLV